MAVAPSIKTHEFVVSGVDPVGQRHLTTHSSFVKEISTSPGAFLNFGSVNTTFSKQTTTPTKAILMFSDDFKDANEAIFNMKFWLPDTSDFVAGTFNFNGFVSGVWVSGLFQDPLTDASGLFIPTALPSGANIRRQDGWPEISGINQDSEVTEHVYLSWTADTDVPPNVYGRDTGGFTYRLTFDFR
jgi:hypothetical protein